MFESIIRFVESMIAGMYELAPVYISVEEE